MKREIKFRAVVIDDDGNKRLEYNVWPSGDRTVYVENGGFYMVPDQIHQFTGLKDLNGKEIFEGDIIVAYNAEQTGIDDEQGEIMANVTGKVFFEDGAFHYDGHSAGAIPLNYNIEDIEVIGNIYENPELLDFNITE